MKRKPPTSLLVINAALLAALAWLNMGGPAGAQQVSRASGRYSMVHGWVMNCDPEVVYITDESNHEVVAVMWDERVKKFTGLGYRNLANDNASFQQTR
jgi:hypothetical protein